MSVIPVTPDRGTDRGDIAQLSPDKFVRIFHKNGKCPAFFSSPLSPAISKWIVRPHPSTGTRAGHPARILQK